MSRRERYRKGKCLYVTDIVAVKWCEQQLAYSLQTPLPPTPEMISGQQIHATLEAEYHDLVSVPVESTADSWGLRLINMINGLSQLLTFGSTRELSVFGFLPSSNIPLVGVIDLLSVRFNASTSNEPYELVLSDTKTYASSRPPTSMNAQHSTQLNLYAHLLSSLSETITSSFWSILEIDLLAPFSVPFQQAIHNARLVKTIEAQIECVSDLIAVLLPLVARLPKSPFHLEIEYLSQRAASNHLRLETDSDASTTKFTIKNGAEITESIKDVVQRAIYFWENGENAECGGVELEEAWKCTKCAFKDQCAWREKKARELMNKT